MLVYRKSQVWGSSVSLSKSIPCPGVAGLLVQGWGVDTGKGDTPDGFVGFQREHLKDADYRTEKIPCDPYMLTHSILALTP